jgi:hypothetical protein
MVGGLHPQARLGLIVEVADSDACHGPSPMFSGKDIVEQ